MSNRENWVEKGWTLVAGAKPASPWQLLDMGQIENCVSSLITC